MKHTHSWKKYKGTVYYCTYPTCYLKYDIQFLHGKLAQCHECQRDFIIFPGKFDPESLWINCPDCKDKECPLTLDGVKRTITGMIRNDVKEALHLKILTLNRKARDLQAKENQITKKELQLSQWEKRLYEKSQRDEQEIVEKRQKLFKQLKERRRSLNELKNKKLPKVLTQLTDVGDLILQNIDEQKIGIESGVE